jgi:hypothetical protein
MAKSINIKLTLNAPNELIQIVRESVNLKIDKAMSKVRDDVRTLFPDMIRQEFHQSYFYKGISGDYSDEMRDLQAQFGLVDGGNHAILDGIEEILVDSIKIDKSRGRYYGIDVYLNESSTKNKLLSEWFSSYVSTNAKDDQYLIEWLRWCLTGSGEAESAIFFGSFINETFSRSGRAYMGRNPSANHWSLQRDVESPEELDFVAKLFDRIKFQNQLTKIVTKRLKEYIDG